MTRIAATLPIHIRPGNLQTSPAVEAWVRRKLAGAIRRHGSKMTAVEVHFEDVNGPKHGAADARCVMEARVNGRKPVAVEARAQDLYAAIDAAARKLDAGITRAVERKAARAQRRFRKQHGEVIGAAAPQAVVAAEDARTVDTEGGADARMGAERVSVIIAGFGPVGRALADELVKHGVAITVVDTNPETIRRQKGLGVRAICGDITDSDVLRRAGIETATALAITIPDGADVVKACEAARALSPNVHITARTTFLSQGMEAMRAGANAITVEEIATANALAQVVSRRFADSPGEPASEPATTSLAPAT